MGQRLKRWESPRQTGRNTKGRGGSARQRQLQKRQQTWRQRLREEGQGQTNQTKREGVTPPVFTYRRPESGNPLNNFSTHPATLANTITRNHRDQSAR